MAAAACAGASPCPAIPFDFLQWGMFPEAVSASPLLHNLNPEQSAAVTLPNEHALILAGAGSGKTGDATGGVGALFCC